MVAPELQILVVFSTIFISAATFLLARKLIVKYAKTRVSSYLLWGIGMWLFGLAAFLEAEFALGIYSAALIDFYLFIVVVLVQFLSFGSVELVKTMSYRKAYYAFSIAIAALVLLSVAFTAPGDLMQNYVVTGAPGLAVIITSTIATSAASVVLVVTAVKSYIAKRNPRMLSIIAGVVIVAAAGSFYIAAVPEFLYYSEFIGMVLLWLGFS
jgi:hypothetical protein